MAAVKTASEELLTATIQETPETFLHPTEALLKAALVTAKRYVDPLAKQHSVFDQIHIDGLHVDQIWQQIKAISESVVDAVLEADLPESSAVQMSMSDASDMGDMSDEDGLELGSEMELEEDEDVSDPDSGEEEYASEEEAPLDLELEDEQDEALEASDADEEAQDESEDDGEEAQQDVFGLNDQFFDIDDFNRQTEIMDANYEAAQSEDDVDYNADPDEASDMDDLEQEGDAGDNANEIRYDDFFAPPKRAFSHSHNTGKRKRVRRDVDGDEEAEPAESTMARMQKDLFADDDAAMADDAADAESGPKLSAYAKRQLKLKREIEQLEMENVGKKDWTLMGEASAKARPKDSLLEEAMDFERTSKPVPVVTEEVTASLEDMIKARIVARQFDTVVRKIPESAHKFAKNTFELDDSKPQQSLADVYEQEIQKRADPSGFKSAKDLKLDKEHAEIEQLYKDVCYNLDALSSWHYTPKPVTESLQIVTNAPAIAMEDAQPLTLSSRARLAPQEQFGVQAEKGEVVGKAGLPTSKAEMTSEERQRHRRRQRAVAKKSGAQKQEAKGVSSKTAEKQQVLETLKQGDVKVISGGKARSIQTGRQGKTSRSLANIKL